jgi:hypothetical protein
LVVAAPAVDLRGIVRDADGAPMAEVQVYFSTTFLPEFPFSLERTTDPYRAPCATGADGRFTLRRVPRERVDLSVDGADLCVMTVPVEKCTPQGEVRIEVLRRCNVRIEGEPGTSVGFLDGNGNDVWLETRSQGFSGRTRDWALTGTTSPLLTLSESAVTMVWSRDGKELGRKTIALRTGATNLTTLAATK